MAALGRASWVNVVAVVVFAAARLWTAWKGSDGGNKKEKGRRKDPLRSNAANSKNLERPTSWYTTVCKNLVGDGSVFVCFLALRFVFCLLVFATFTTSSSSVSYSYICPRPRPLLLLVSLVCSLCLSFSPLIFSSSPAFSECTSFKVAIWIGRAVFTVWP